MVRARVLPSGCVALLAVATAMVGLPAVRPLLATAQAKPADPPVASVRSTLDSYCVSCHNDRVRTGGLSLERLSIDTVDVPAQAETWEKVVAKIRTRTMPPPGARRPDEGTMASVATWLETTLDDAAAKHPNPGRPAIHRLNRVEYTNAIRDLLALEVDGRSLLPSDDQGYGFDNNADALTTSPGLMDRYLLAARKIGRLAVGDPTLRPFVQTFTVSRLLTQEDRMDEDQPFGSRGGLTIRHYFPLDAEYVIRVRLQAALARAKNEQVEVRLDGHRIKLFTIGETPIEAGAIGEGLPEPVLEARIAAKAGPRAIGVALLKRTSAPEGVGAARMPVGNISFRAAGVAAVSLEGPFNPQGPGDTPARRRIFQCRPQRVQDEKRCASEILSSLARRAYRRPATDQDLAVLMGFFEKGRADGFEYGIRTALERILIDPEFLFRLEREPAVHTPPAGPYRISDLELASRLSFFLWSSIPDDELLQVASAGKLANRAVLIEQVRRMLADPKSEALVSNFAAQWLHLRNLRAAAPDLNAFPEFDDNLRDAFQRETELFLQSQLRADRSITELLTANYTYVNERLARHYGMPNIYGSHFRRVTVDRPERKGLLGHGSILTVTSYSTRTSPVLRGKWLLDNILGAPPPAPPANVPALKENDEAGTPQSVRGRMEEHRKNPVCSSCHARMDPLGFALENFDAIGRWRDAEEDHSPIDASGAFVDGTAFDGPAALHQILVSHRDEFVTTVTDKMLTYALGRGLDYRDRPALRRIVHEAEAGDYTWSSIVLGIVTSTPFQMRNARP